MVEVIETGMSNQEAARIVKTVAERELGKSEIKNVSHNRNDITSGGEKVSMVLGSSPTRVRVMDPMIVEEVRQSIQSGSVESDQTGYHSGSSNDSEDRQTEAVIEYSDGEESRRGEEFGRVFKPFDHAEAGYVEPGDDNFDGSHPRCEDCAHWDDKGNCHIVPDVEGVGYCDEFYADVGFFADREGVNLTMWGERIIDIEAKRAWAVAVKQDIVEKLQDKLSLDMPL